MEIKLNNYYLIKEDVQNLKGYAEFAKVNKLPIMSYSAQKDVSGFYTRGLHINNFAQNPFVLDNNKVIEITHERANKLERKINKNYLKKAKEIIKELNVKRIPIIDRKDYSIASKQFLNTKGNYVNQYPNGFLIKNNYNIDTEGKISQTPGSICCSFSRSSRDMLIYIPTSWLKYFGYSIVDVKSWFKFLEGCEINFEGKILGKKTLREVFGQRVNNSNVNNFKKLNNIYQNVDEDCIEVFLNANPNFIRHTYLRFIVVRFLYSCKYWNIPTIAMKLKKKIPSLTNWECLLVAHCTENYDGYYSLVDNTYTNFAIPSQYNSPKKLFERLINEINMNRSFRKYNKNTGELRRAIVTEDFKTIEKIVKEYRDVN